jgi:hypothetical protein
VKKRRLDSISKGRDGLFLRLKEELKHADDESSYEQFDEAEATVDRYLESVRQRGTDMPTSENLAFACAILLLMTNSMEQRDFDLLGELCAPDLGIDMIALAPQVAELKTRAIAGLEALAKQENSARTSGEDDGTVPF